MGTYDDAGTATEERMNWSEALQCHWVAWRSVSAGELALDLPPDNFCDMAGAVNTGTVLTPDVWLIHTFVDGVADTCYRKAGGKWAAFAPAVGPQKERTS